MSDLCVCGHSDLDHYEATNYEDIRDEFEMHCQHCKCDGFRFPDDD